MRSFLLAINFASNQAKSNLRSKNPSCPSPSASEECEIFCNQYVVSCIDNCTPDDMNCIADCNRVHASCSSTCPCHDQCWNGCPCDYLSFYCPEVSEYNVLIMNQFNPSNPPVITSFNGDVVESHGVTIASDTEIDNSCSLMMNGQYYIFGGYQKNKQVSKLDGCQVVSTNNQIPAPFMSGACGTYTYGGKEVSFLCFSAAEPSSCVIWDETRFSDLPAKSITQHRSTRLSNFKGDPFVFGGCCDHNTEHNMAETYSDVQSKWILENEYPFSRVIKLYDTVSINTETENRVIVFGGRIDKDLQSGTLIAQFDGSWSQLGSLKIPRDGHSAILQGDEVLIIGGYSNGPNPLPTEKWNIKTGESTIIQPTLDRYAFYPELFFVYPGYCQ